MRILEHEYRIGAERPFEVLHISDTHLTLADEREQDGGRKLELAQKRAEVFPHAQQQLEEAAALAREMGAPILHTGDLTDFVSEANLAAAARFVAENDCVFSAGNHEFSLYVGEAKEDAAYRERSLARVQACFANDIRFSARVMHGVNFVALDNSYYRVEPWQLRALKAEVAKGLPIVLMVHTPLYSPDAYEKVLALYHGKPPVCLLSVPEELLGCYSPYRYEQQKEDAATHEAYAYILGEPAIRLVLAGHIHEDADTMLTGRLPQLITGIGTARRIRFA